MGAPFAWGRFTARAPAGQAADAAELYPGRPAWQDARDKERSPDETDLAWPLRLSA